MPVNILDLARPKTLDAPEDCHDDIERSIPRAPMTTLDHAIRAFCLVVCLILWPAIGTVIATLLHLHGLASLAVTWLWPFAFAPLALIIFRTDQAADPTEHIDGYNDR